MPRRTLWIERPGTDGNVTDLLVHQLPLRALERSQDAVLFQGLVRQRRGWRYDGTTADVAANLQSVGRFRFVLAAVTRTLTHSGTALYIHNPSSAGTLLFSGGPTYLPRAVYNDELLLCAQDGLTPLRRYSGAGFGPALSYTGTITLAEGEAATGGTLSLSQNPGGGSYCRLHRSNAAFNVMVPIRVLESSTSSVVLQDTRAGAGGGGITAGGSTAFEGTAYGFGAVAIYDAGTLTFDNGTSTATGYGTKWSSGGVSIIVGTGLGPHGIIITPPTGDATYYDVNVVSSDTSLQLRGGANASVTTKSTYKLTARLPFKDVASHKDSLWGIGVAQHKSRVYVGPPGWNISFPPGQVLPFDPYSTWSAENEFDFLMDFIDVPGPNDADECVAILPSENPLLALKRKDAYGIYGVYGALDRAMLPNGEGAGCLDIRSAHTLSLGPVWAGEQDVFAYVGGRVIGLTAGRMGREWRDIAAAFNPATDYITIGEKDGVLVVHASVGNGGTRRTWHCYPIEDGQLRPRWFGPITNVQPRYFFSSKVSGEQERLFMVQDIDQGRVINYGPAIDGTGPARDEDGTSPVLEFNTSARLAREAGADVDERLLEVAIEANLYDTGGAGSALGGLISSKQALDSDAEIVTNLSSMASKAVDLTKPYVHPVGAKAALHQVRLTKSATQTTEQRTEISRIGLTLRRSKRPL